MNISKLFFVLIISILISPSIMTAEANQQKNPHSELKILEDTISGVYNGEKFTVRKYTTIHTYQRDLSIDFTMSFDEAANIKIIKPYTGKNLVEQYRNRLSVTKESYAVLARNDEVAEKYCSTLGMELNNTSIIKYAFSMGQFYTLQNGKKTYIIKDGYLFDGNQKVNLENVFSGPSKICLKDIKQLGIPIFSYLYQDSNVTKNLSSNKDDSHIAELITMDGESLIRYTFINHLDNGDKMSHMYFFDELGNLSKYGYDYRHSTIPPKKLTLVQNKNKIALYDIIEFKTFIPDKKIFNLSKEKKVEIANNYILDLI